MSGAHHHPVDDLSLKFRDHVNPLERVRLGHNIWVGTHAVIMSDIGSGVVIAAGAIVTKLVDEMPSSRVFLPSSLDIEGKPRRL